MYYAFSAAFLILQTSSLHYISSIWREALIDCIISQWYISLPPSVSLAPLPKTMPDERWKPLIGTPSKPPIPSDILVPDPSPARSLISDAESPTLLPPSPGGSFVHRRRQGQYVPRPPIWKIHDYEEACEDTYNAGEGRCPRCLSSLGYDCSDRKADSELFHSGL